MNREQRRAAAAAIRKSTAVPVQIGMQQLLTKIGGLTVENDFLRQQNTELQEQIERLVEDSETEPVDLDNPAKGDPIVLEEEADEDFPKEEQPTSNNSGEPASDL